MSSFGGAQDQNNPFGYDLTSLSGIGLPPFRTPGPPPGQPLLNQNEQQNFSNFLNGFDNTGIQTRDDAHFADMHHQLPMDGDWDLPHYLGAETSLGTRAPLASSQLQNVTDLSHLDAAGPGLSQMVPHPFDGSVHPSHPLYAPNTYQTMFVEQLQASANIPSAFSESWQDAPSESYLTTNGPGRPQIRYGTDTRFQANGFVAPGPHINPDLNQMQTYQWLEAQSSATNTAPSSAQNTNPSTPVMARKRKLDELQELPSELQHLPNNYDHPYSGAISAPTGPQTPHRRSIIKQDPNPPTPVSQPTPNARVHIGDATSSAGDDAEAEAESDNDTNRPQTSPSSPPGPWPANKARPPRKPPKPTKQRSRKTGSSASQSGPSPTTLKSKSKSFPLSQNHKPRVTLTAEQKKANHTNSEQRRRDLTGRAYQELFDLVPALEHMGKQSTMKKLEVVVARLRQITALVQRLKERRDRLRESNDNIIRERWRTDGYDWNQGAGEDRGRG